LNDDRISVRIPEACRLIGISRSKLYELIEAGEIQTAKVGASRLVLVKGLETFVQSRIE
jgi:excisionase family DNA binding protein